MCYICPLHVPGYLCQYRCAIVNFLCTIGDLELGVLVFTGLECEQNWVTEDKQAGVGVVLKTMTHICERNEQNQDQNFFQIKMSAVYTSYMGSPTI